MTSDMIPYPIDYVTADRMTGEWLAVRETNDRATVRDMYEYPCADCDDWDTYQRDGETRIALVVFTKE